MITEKGISDYVWCQTLYRDLEGNAKRVKPDRPDNTLEAIKEALQTQQPNKKCVVDTSRIGKILVESYSNDFWLAVPTATTSLLVTLSYVLKEENKIRFVRKRDRRPRTEEAMIAERFIRRMIYREVKQNFYAPVTVETQYLGDQTLYCDNLEPKQLEEADAFFEKVREVADGEAYLAINQNHCPYCWWKACPHRKEDTTPKQIKGTSSTRMI